MTGTKTCAYCYKPRPADQQYCPFCGHEPGQRPRSAVIRVDAGEPPAAPERDEVRVERGVVDRARWILSCLERPDVDEDGDRWYRVVVPAEWDADQPAHDLAELRRALEDSHG